MLLEKTGERKWILYTFFTTETEDVRPLKYNPKYPWWIVFQAQSHTNIRMYLPDNENLSHYYDDAYDIESEVHYTIVYTNRFPKPNWTTN
jgi:hypothetical protein